MITVHSPCLQCNFCHSMMTFFCFLKFLKLSGHSRLLWRVTCKTRPLGHPVFINFHAVLKAIAVKSRDNPLLTPCHYIFNELQNWTYSNLDILSNNSTCIFNDPCIMEVLLGENILYTGCLDFHRIKTVLFSEQRKKIFQISRYFFN